MDILSYLATLVKTHKEVGIEGLGTITRIKVPGRYDSENHTFIPPTHSLSFSENLSEQYLLRNYIAKNRNISVESADYFISVFANELHEQLAEGKEVAFGDLGKLAKHNDILLLEKNNSTTFSHGFYGLPILNAEPPKAQSLIEDNSTENINDDQDLVSKPIVDVNDSWQESHDNQEIFEEISEFEAPHYSPAPFEIETAEDLQPDDEQLGSQEVNGIADEIYGHTKPSHDPATSSEAETVEQELVQIDETLSTEVANEPKVEESNEPGDLPHHDDETKSEWEIEQQNDLEPQNELGEQNESEKQAIITIENNSDVPQTNTEFPVIASDPSVNGSANIWHFDRAKSRPAEVKKTFLPTDVVEQNKPLWVKFMIVAGILAILLALLYFMKPSIFSRIAQFKKPKIVSSKSPTPAKIVIDTIKPVDTLKAGVLPSITDSTAADTATTWEIIGASLTKKEVKKYVADMRTKGITAKPIPAMPGRRIKMSIATFNDEKSAKDGRKELVKKLRNDELYIYQNKHTYKPI
ncbi:MAG: hypothetical protein V4687_18465 [Bacteroidota bacterium]